MIDGGRKDGVSTMIGYLANGQTNHVEIRPSLPVRKEFSLQDSQSQASQPSVTLAWTERL